MAKKAEPNRRKATISDFVDEACGEFESLQEEMQERFDNMPENLQGGDVGSRVEEAAQALGEVMERPDFPEGVTDDEIEIVLPGRTPKQTAKMSRADRRDDAVQILAAVVDRLQTKIDELDQAQSGGDESDDTTNQVEALTEYMEGLQNRIDNAEAVEFPGMYG